MKASLFLLVSFFISSAVNGQSAVSYGPGTAIIINSGADVSAGTIILNGVFKGSGTFNYGAYVPGTMVTITMLPEGYAANPASNLALPAEIFTIHVANAASPYAEVESHTALLDKTTLTASANFTSLTTGTYYVYITHHNTIETWSKSGGEQVTANSAFTYNFTTAKTQAFGDNLVLANGKYCLYSGDVDSSGFIDNNDLLTIDNDAYHFVAGTAITDIDGSKFVDNGDLLICDNNAFNYVSVKKPGVTSIPAKRVLRIVAERVNENK